MRWISLLCLSLLFSVSSLSSQSRFALLEDWVVDLAEAESFQYPQQFFLGGLSRQEQAFFVASGEGLLTKRSLKSGAPLWSTRLAGASQSQWAIYEDVLYGGDTEGRLYAISASTGEILWSRKNKGLYFAAPFVEGDFLWVANSFGDLECYRRADGEFVWQVKDPDSVRVGLWSEQSPSRFGEDLVAGFPSGLLQALNPQTGERVWTSSFRAVGNEALGLNDLGSFTTAGNYLVASSFNGNTRAWKLSGQSKRQIWEKRLSLPGPVSFSENQSRFYASDRQSRLAAYDSESGLIEWQVALAGGIGTQPLLENDRVWVGTSGGYVQVFSSAGELIAETAHLQTEFYNQPVFVDEARALVLSSKGILRLFQIKAVQSEQKPTLSRWREVLKIF